MSAAEDTLHRLQQHDRLVAALLHDTQALAEPPSQRSLVQTHISSLVMAGTRVYKLRKPLRLQFLDFSTLERRHQDCLDELTVNRRTAPQIYIDVVPVIGTPDHPRIGADAAAPVIDWALRMHRFDDALRLDRLAAAGRLSPSLIDRLADVVARFHVALPPSPPAYGQVGTVRHWAIENFDSLQAAESDATRAARLRALRDATHADLDRLSPRLVQRRADGFVREGHGDLHLGNIVLIGGRPVLFDALEFNPALRHIDVVADLAFLFMDLRRHALSPWAWRLVNAWTEHTGDYAGLALLPFFAVYRAMVRAKVARLRAAQHDAEAMAAFEHDLALAEQLAAPRTGPPRLLVTCGVSGSGKSTLALNLVEALGAIRIRSDIERKRLLGVAPWERPTPAQVAAWYGHDVTQQTYARLHALAADLLHAGLDVIVDAACLRRAERDGFRQLAGRLGAACTLLACDAPLPTLRARVRHRQLEDRDASDADLSVLERQLAHREPVADDEAAHAIHTDQPVEHMLQSALRAVRGPGT